MTKSLKITAVALATLLAAQVAQTSTADAGPRQRFIGGLAAGIALSAIAGAAYAHDRVIVRDGCGYYRQRALTNEANGHFGRANYFWDRFNSCRGY